MVALLDEVKIGPSFGISSDHMRLKVQVQTSLDRGIEVQRDEPTEKPTIIGHTGSWGVAAPRERCDRLAARHEDPGRRVIVTAVRANDWAERLYLSVHFPRAAGDD